MFELTENDYRSNEFQLAVNAVIGKDLRIANPVTLLVSPYTVAEAQALGLVALPGVTTAPNQVSVPPDDNPFSPRYARCESGVSQNVKNSLPNFLYTKASMEKYTVRN